MTTKPAVPVEDPVSTPLVLGGRDFVWGRRTYVMGILNITPDSFSGDGLHGSISKAVRVAAGMIEAGVDILDVGGESTRPGAVGLDARHELERVVPAIEALRRRFAVPISVDTYKASVARAALEAGADMVNDVWGLRADPAMAAVVAERHVPVIVMHNRSNPKHLVVADLVGSSYAGAAYDDLLSDVSRELMVSVDMATAAGVPPHHIVLDPGLGFGKTVEQNLELVDRIGEIRLLGYPVLLGPSRKSFIGLTLNLPPNDRVEGTAATVAVGITRGADLVRVHDVRQMVRVARMTDALVRRHDDGAHVG